MMQENVYRLCTKQFFLKKLQRHRSKKEISVVVDDSEYPANFLAVTKSPSAWSKST